MGGEGEGEGEGGVEAEKRREGGEGEREKEGAEGAETEARDGRSEEGEKRQEDRAGTGGDLAVESHLAVEPQQTHPATSPGSATPSPTVSITEQPPLSPWAPTVSATLTASPSNSTRSNSTFSPRPQLYPICHRASPYPRSPTTHFLSHSHRSSPRTLARSSSLCPRRECNKAPAALSSPWCFPPARFCPPSMDLMPGGFLLGPFCRQPLVHSRTVSGPAFDPVTVDLDNLREAEDVVSPRPLGVDGGCGGEGADRAGG